jgi:hypothetical protein
MLEKTDLETLLPLFEKLTAETKAKWGTMNAQRMVEHLSDTLQIATQKLLVTPVVIDLEKIVKMQAWLETDKEMAQNIEVDHAQKNTPLRNEELELAVDEFVDELLHFEEFFEKPNTTSNHPFYGDLNYKQWQLMNKKHFTHHFKQFGLID